MTNKAHFNKLTPAEAERLAFLIEELGEALQCAGKILRHGYESVNPIDPGDTNRLALELELGDVRAAVELMEQACDVERVEIATAAARKLNSVKRWMHHQ